MDLPSSEVTEKQLQIRCLLLTIFAASIGGTFQYGFNLTIINAPTTFIQNFINETWTERYGTQLENWVITLIWTFIVVAYSVGGLVGAFIAGPMAIRFGREILGNEKLWPLLLASCAVPALIQLITLPWCPESPRYLLIDRKNKDLCMKAMRRLCGNVNLTAEMDEMLEEQMALEGQRAKTLWELFCDRSVKHQLIITFVLGSAMQLCGNDAVNRALSFNVSDNVRERFSPDLPGNKTGQTTWHQLQHRNQPWQTQSCQLCWILHDNIWALLPTFGELSPRLVKQQPDVVIFTKLYVTDNVPDISIINPGYALSHWHDSSTRTGGTLNLFIDRIGRKVLLMGGYSLMVVCGILFTISLTLQDKISWMPYLSMVCIFASILSFGIGPAGVTGIIPMEIFDQTARPAAYMINGSLQWINLTIVGLAFPFIVEGVGGFCYVPFLFISFLAVVFIGLFLPETKGKTLLEISQEFHKRNFKGQLEETAM
ncbi:solute carrier family 2, facilitated glucose transporter member 11-like [Mustelus asterias]